MKTLSNIYFTLCKQGYCTDKGMEHSYIEVYEQILEPYRNGNCLEIGIFRGDSLRMWEKYFTGEVYGVDCSETPIDGMANLGEMIASGEHNIYIFNAESSAEVWEHFGGKTFDVIIEDAGHNIEQQLEMYRIFKEYLNPGGVYIIEDIQDLDKDRERFEQIDKNKTVEILDRRGVKNRYDDVLVIIKDK